METLYIALLVASICAISILIIIARDINIVKHTLVKVATMLLHQIGEEDNDTISGRQKSIYGILKGIASYASTLSDSSDKSLQHLADISDQEDNINRIRERVFGIGRIAMINSKNLSKIIDILESHYEKDIYNVAQDNLSEAEIIAEEVQKSAEEAVIVEPEVIDQIEEENAVKSEYDALKEKAREYSRQGHNISWIASKLSKSRRTITRWLKEQE